MIGVVKSPDAPLVKVRIDAVCHECKHRHQLHDLSPDGFTAALWAWQGKHSAHVEQTELLTTKRTIPRRFRDKIYEKLGIAPWWLQYKENADMKIAYASSAQLTIPIINLVSSATFVGGAESDSVSNTTNLYVDYRIAGFITTGGTAPTVNTEIRVYAVAAHNDAGTWPDVFDGTNSTETVSRVQILDQLPIIGSTLVDANINITYPFSKMLTIAETFGIVPKLWVLFVAHATGQNLNGTAANHNLSHTGAYFTSI